jgi:hypothetical protein
LAALAAIGSAAFAVFRIFVDDLVALVITAVVLLVLLSILSLKARVNKLRKKKKKSSWIARTLAVWNQLNKLRKLGFALFLLVSSLVEAHLLWIEFYNRKKFGGILQATLIILALRLEMVNGFTFPTHGTYLGCIMTEWRQSGFPRACDLRAV